MKFAHTRTTNWTLATFAGASRNPFPATLQPNTYCRGGGEETASDDPSFWQEALPAEPERLCVVLNPVYDFRWQSFSCSGPDVKPFVCQLEGGYRPHLSWYSTSL